MAAKQQDTKLEGVINFRDVGKTVNVFLNNRRLREGVFYRSARLDEATEADKVILREQMRIASVIDLRTKTEHIKQAEKHQARIAAAAATAPLESDEAVAKPLQVAGLKYYDIRITGPQFEKYLVSQLSWWAYIKFLALFITGYRLQAIHIIGHEVMAPRGLVGLGIDSIDQSPDDVRAVLALYTDSKNLPNVVHCTQGKDRTGLVCILLLMILDVPTAAIEHDYLLTDGELVAEREARIKELRELGVPDAWVNTDPNMVKGVEKHLKEKYGGLDNYLDQIGFTKEDRTKVQEALLY